MGCGGARNSQRPCHNGTAVCARRLRGSPGDHDVTCRQRSDLSTAHLGPTDCRTSTALKTNQGKLKAEAAEMRSPRSRGNCCPMPRAPVSHRGGGLARGSWHGSGRSRPRSTASPTRAADASRSPPAADVNPAARRERFPLGTQTKMPQMGSIIPFSTSEVPRTAGHLRRKQNSLVTRVWGALVCSATRREDIALHRETPRNKGVQTREGGGEERLLFLIPGS